MNTDRCRNLRPALVAAGLLTLVLAGEAAAQTWKHDRYGSVTAYSRYGNGSVTGAIRRAYGGYEVRLPGGTWIFCKRDCANTLREESIDFWETRRERGGGDRRR